MKSNLKRLTAGISALAAATALVACSSDPVMSSFQNPRPWETSVSDSAYEKLDYAVAIYDTKKSAAVDKRVQIAGGTLTYVLNEGPKSSTGGEAQLDMTCEITYNDKAPTADVGLTDRLSSTTVFHTDSLATETMQKTVALAAREGKKDTSYTLKADYDSGKVTREMYGKTKTKKLPNDTYWDNETMFYLARATKVKKGSSTTFYMMSLFDSFLNGETEQYIMTASSAQKLNKMQFDNWLKPYVVTAEEEKAEADKDKNNDKDAKTAEGTTDGAADDTADATTFELPCFKVNISANKENAGPPYCIYYSERPFKDGEIKHKKVPVKITYPLYEGSKLVRQVEYTLTALSFERP